MNNDEKLIELVKAHRAIYDKTDVFYSNKDYVKELWQEIAKEMDQTVPVCQKRWRYLRDYFVRQLHMTQNQNIQQNGTSLSMITSPPVSDSSNVTTTTIVAVNNNSNNNNSNNGTQKKKTFWAFYDKMLFLKPFSSTRKVKSKSGGSRGINRRQNQGHFNKTMISTQSTSSEIDQITVHTVSDSNSADDEFDSFEYMTMYQMQFGTEADKAELQCNGVYRIADSIEELQQQQQQQQKQQQQQLQQQQEQLQFANQQIVENSGKQENNAMTATTVIKDTQQLRYQEPIKIIYKSNSSNIRPTIEYHAKNTNNNAATVATVGVASTSTSIAKPMQQQQQQQTRKLSHFLATATPSSSATATTATAATATTSSPTAHLRSSSAKKRKRSEICEEILDILKRTESDDLERNDEHAMFFKSLLNSVRKIDEEHILAFRTEIIQIIMKYRYMSQQNDKNGSNSDVVVVDTGEMHWRHKLPC